MSKDELGAGAAKSFNDCLQNEQPFCAKRKHGGTATSGEACIDFSGSLSRTAYNLPQKKQRVAVGGGLAGLACALRLITKKYHVEIFEAEARIGGGKWDCVDENLFLLDVRC